MLISLGTLLELLLESFLLSFFHSSLLNFYYIDLLDWLSIFFVFSLL